MFQRTRVVVPFGVVAHHGGGVLHAVYPFHVAAPFAAVTAVARQNDHGRLIAVGVIDRHGRVLRADGAVHGGDGRLAFDLGVAVAHGRRDLFVITGDELGLIAAVAHQRFMDAAEARARIGDEILDAERLDHVHHVVGAGTLDELALRATSRGVPLRRDLSRRRRRRTARLCLLRLGIRSHDGGG